MWNMHNGASEMEFTCYKMNIFIKYFMIGSNMNFTIAHFDVVNGNDHCNVENVKDRKEDGLIQYHLYQHRQTDRETEIHDE